MRKYKSFFLIILVLIIPSTVIYFFHTLSNLGDDYAPVGIVGVQHLGHDYNVSDFYVNKYSGSNVGREGGGGGSVCCILIPLTWHPGLIVEVRWQVADWSHENRKEIEAGNYVSIRKEGTYIAKVPVEKYQKAGDLYVHFFPKGKVRVVSTMHSILSPSHPILYGAQDGGTTATSGSAITELFTQYELQEFRSRRNSWR